MAVLRHDFSSIAAMVVESRLCVDALRHNTFEGMLQPELVIVQSIWFLAQAPEVDFTVHTFFVISKQGALSEHPAVAGILLQSIPVPTMTPPLLLPTTESVVPVNVPPVLVVLSVLPAVPPTLRLQVDSM
jgi:hypothetical protein